eukprot:5815572-Amphidinium_carterae.2
MSKAAVAAKVAEMQKLQEKSTQDPSNVHSYASPHKKALTLRSARRLQSKSQIRSCGSNMLGMV